MKPSVDKLHKFIKLEIERGYDNRAVVGGFSRMVDGWEAEARLDSLPEELIQAVSARLRDYGNLSPASRSEVLEGLHKRLVSETGAPALKFVPPKPPEPVLAPSPSNSLAQGARDQDEALIFPVRRGRGSKSALSYAAQGQSPALDAPVTVLDGVGPRNAQTLGRLGIYTLRDMLYYFPRRHNDYAQMKPINRLAYGENVTVIGSVQSLSTRRTQGGLQMYEAVLSDGTASMRITWFGSQKARRLQNGSQIAVAGKTDQYLGRLVMKNPEWEPVEAESLNTGRIVPVYSGTANITQAWMRKKFFDVISYYAPRLSDPLPDTILNSNGLLALPDAIKQAHFPDSHEMLHAAQQRLAFDEVFQLQLGLLKQKKTWQSREGRVFEVPAEWLEQVIQQLPFTLTGAQTRAVEDIRSDLASGKPMNRLLQGDVGSGKTVVAALAISMVTRQGSQAALMAPTGILAEQHYRSMLRLLAGEANDSEDAEAAPTLLSPEQIRLLVGATGEAEKADIRAGLENGSIKLIIGTHALIEDPVTFSDLELTIVDEQHRFGVEQRNSLRSKGTNPHLIVMTATPIPRSLALSVYGDLDLSIIDEMPPGRQDILTYVLTPVERERAYQLIRSQVQQGRQAFIIYPLVEETENSEMRAGARAAVDEHARLQAEIFPQLRLGLLHGRMRPDEKEDVMQHFRGGEYHILVSTSVVEVGVDIPNATVMLIEGANRFGLAQLHQFRGRVGRGAEKSFCLLIPETADAIENERLQVMTSTNDGFVLAEYDLKQRGPGEFLGTRQSGFSPLQLANLANVPLIDKARRSAQVLFDSDPNLEQPEHQLLSSFLDRFWGAQAEVS
jgi:ATP-dependent DNA helicase RecG